MYSNFRFIYNSPVKNMNTRTPLSNRTNIRQPVQLDFEKMKPVTCIPSAGLPECHLVAKNLTANEIEDVWMDMTLKRYNSTHSSLHTSFLRSSFARRPPIGKKKQLVTVSTETCL